MDALRPVRDSFEVDPFRETCHRVSVKVEDSVPQDPRPLEFPERSSAVGSAPGS